MDAWPLPLTEFVDDNFTDPEVLEQERQDRITLELQRQRAKALAMPDSPSSSPPPAAQRQLPRAVPDASTDEPWLKLPDDDFVAVALPISVFEVWEESDRHGAWEELQKLKGRFLNRLVHMIDLYSKRNQLPMGEHEDDQRFKQNVIIFKNIHWFLTTPEEGLPLELSLGAVSRLRRLLAAHMPT